MVNLSTGAFVGVILACVIFTAIVAGISVFFITRNMFKKQLKENPPINEKMIRIMFKQMGRTASETQIRQIMRSIKGEQ
ncbi:YneF family protein [Mycoplasma nasistruthionis]|uniref:YneF family protein n=1 Tax=Mycoplasma nasistruthionis TaxID=353852 RepID=A0A4Y6I5I5_9MOLU|nr:YneF family protein [Mycoplasma nasistruthionis]QCZ36575.1 YneF family protein [Mycoplasma nasistruthionis]QDF64875.1 YneF family protein [Mycoplasma nasistruthionis]